MAVRLKAAVYLVTGVCMGTEIGCGCVRLSCFCTMA